MQQGKGTSAIGWLGSFLLCDFQWEILHPNWWRVPPLPCGMPACAPACVTLAKAAWLFPSPLPPLGAAKGEVLPGSALCCHREGVSLTHSGHSSDSTTFPIYTGDPRAKILTVGCPRSLGATFLPE